MKHLIAILAMTSATAHAEFWDGNALLKRMNGDQYDKFAALGYVAGASDVGQGVHHCAPTNVTVGQVSDMVKKTLETMPEHRHKSADSFVITALSVAFPCPDRKSSRGTTL